MFLFSLQHEIIVFCGLYKYYTTVDGEYSVFKKQSRFFHSLRINFVVYKGQRNFLNSIFFFAQ